MKIYTMNVLFVMAVSTINPVRFKHSFYPPPPQLIIYPVDDPEWHVFYAVRTGVRYTGMPAWNKALSEQDIWKVTAFLSRIEKLPPAVQDYWKKSFGIAPPAGDPRAKNTNVTITTKFVEDDPDVIYFSS